MGVMLLTVQPLQKREAQKNSAASRLAYKKQKRAGKELARVLADGAHHYTSAARCN
jgi:hypothetical protein